METAEIDRELARLGVESGPRAEFLAYFPGEGLAEEEWKRWCAEVDDSPYAWPEWVEAVDLLGRKVRGEGGPSATASGLMGYVGCAAATVRGVAAVPPLSEVVMESFRTFGYAGETD
jgi:hypothetical protein